MIVLMTEEEAKRRRSNLVIEECHVVGVIDKYDMITVIKTRLSNDTNKKLTYPEFYKLMRLESEVIYKIENLKGV